MLGHTVCQTNLLIFILKFDGEGGWDFHLLNNKKMMSLNEEKQTLESQLAGVSKLEERLKEVNALLGTLEEIKHYTIPLFME